MELNDILINFVRGDTVIDISKKEVLIKYLTDTKQVMQGHDLKVKYFDGGVSCTVAFVSSEKGDMIVKQALKKLKVAEEWLSDPKRIMIEMQTNQVYCEIVPEKAPQVYFCDAENYIFGRYAIPEDFVMWKTELMNGILNFNLAEQAISALASVHQTTSQMPELAEKFADKSFFINLRTKPYLEWVALKHPECKAAIDEMIKILVESSLTLVHGDFSPKNMLVKGNALYVLDFEVGHFGHPAFDLAFVTNHLLLKAVKNKYCAKSYLNMLDFMVEKYFHIVKFIERPKLEAFTVFVLGGLFLARVDGKSPVEYITEEADKELIRKIAKGILRERPCTYKEVIEIMSEELK